MHNSNSKDRRGVEFETGEVRETPTPAEAPVTTPARALVHTPTPAEAPVTTPGRALVPTPTPAEAPVTTPASRWLCVYFLHMLVIQSMYIYM